ncbi:glycosyltransferase [Pseudarthrobacter sp. CC12]|uniref:glycosyltransferase n=1 Tax=Pseudarthrobacter sp. CC12 TaxID=3029193 RepID=UPI003263D1FF
MSLHVLHILGSLRPSGMEKMLITAATHFADQGIQSTILGQGDNHPYAHELRSAGYNVQTVPFAVGSRAGARELKSLVRELRVDVIHIHTEGDYLRTAWASWNALGRSKAIVRTIHNVFEATGTWRVKRMIQAQVADRLVHLLVAPSPEVSANERRLFRHVRVIYNWVDDAFFQIRDRRKNLTNSQAQEPVAVIVGNCSNIKQHELALQALKDTSHKVIHLGDESDANEEEREYLEFLNRDGRLLRRGVEAPQYALLTGSYFMMPSRHEGMGVALAEALVAGLPCLVNDAPGLRWARSIDGVEMIPESRDAWIAAAMAMPRKSRGEMPTSIDFSASRGSFEYAEVYRDAAQRKLRRIWSKEAPSVEMG